MSSSDNRLKVIESTDLPHAPLRSTVYRLTPKDADEGYYRERTDRHLGWITSAEQEIIRNSKVGIAGCGGMGGLDVPILTRLGVGEVRIADSENFEVSNINRQFGASRTSVGMSKAFETARLTRAISDDLTLVVYPQGITEETVDHFLDGCDLVCDEIELLALDARILLHARARARGISLFNCNTVGFSTTIFLYTPKSMTIEAALGITYDEARTLVARSRSGEEAATARILAAMMKCTVPRLPEYSPAERQANRAALYARIEKERKAPIIATNPPMASGFLADRILLYLLKNSGVERAIAEVPPMPGYLHFDAATMESRIVTREWF
jgi:molybdopterin/thiamine biosynthesis adenylyltransferase